MAALLTIETVFEDPELRVRWLPGGTKRMVVAFTGLGQEFGAQPVDEFARSAHMEGANSVLFISDLKQSWYSRPGLWARIVAMVKEVRDSEKIEELVTLGNSMGGFGALMLPREVRVQRALGFAPQISMDQEIIAEDRWPEAQSNIDQLPVRNLGETVQDHRTHLYLTAGAGAPRDLAQLDLMPEHRRVHKWVLPGTGHNLAHRLKQAGLLSRLIEALIGGKAKVASKLYSEFETWHATTTQERGT